MTTTPAMTGKDRAMHTPGPWWTSRIYTSDIPENARVVVHAAARNDEHSGMKVAEAEFTTIPNGYHIDSREEAEANARLIAAAPDLLNALTVLADACESMGIPVDAARAAIVKATGATP